MQDFMDKFIGKHEVAKLAFQMLVGEKCPECGKPAGLAVGMEKCAFLICEKCGYQFVRSMDKKEQPKN